ncbi:hypothetical protein C5B94_08740 [Clavibacter michiganensis]|uniref:DUF6518 family protein n=1 Tax=Clavibacter michiganensis TaxID=28447 RepID=UPI000CE751F0|nr:DUF6518 family protein [Clavibacter michiganensis]PPF54119.1 hypothetical protein C5B94_08740 [Clavibacter michiganensis]
MTRPDPRTTLRDAGARPASTPDPRSRETWRTALRAAAIVLVASLVVGGLTSPAQGFLPDPVRPFANSAGGWSMLAFLTVWASGARPPLGALLGAVSFVAMVEAYGVVSLWRGYFLADPLSSMWIPVGLVAGPVIGLAAALVRHAGRGWVVVGVAVLSLVLAAEGTYGLLLLQGTTGAAYWILEIVLAAAFLGAAVLRGRRVDGATH